MSHSSPSYYPAADHIGRHAQPRAQSAGSISRHLHRSHDGYTLTHAGHQVRVDGTQRHHDRQVAGLPIAGHQACPNVAPGTGATLCQAPSRAEAAVAEMTSASASASAMVEVRCSPPPTATRNFLASMTFRSS